MTRGSQRAGYNLSVLPTAPCVNLSDRAGYLAFYALQSFPLNRAVLFTESVGIPKEYFTAVEVVETGTPDWDSVNGHSAGRATDIGDSWYLFGGSDEYLNTLAGTMLLIRKKADLTVRATVGCGVYGDGDTRFSAHLPWSDSKIYFDFGGLAAPNRLSVDYVPSTDFEAWAFRAGPRGSSIWLNGNRVANQTTPITRGATSNPCFINGSGFSTKGDLEDVFFFALSPLEVPDVLLTTFKVCA